MNLSNLKKSILNLPRAKALEVIRKSRERRVKR